MGPTSPDQPPMPFNVSPNPPAAPAGQRGPRIFLWAFVVVGLLAIFAGILFLGLGAMASLASSGDSSVEEKYHSLDHHGPDKVAIITVEGTILDGDGFVKKQIDQVRKDSHVKAVVLRVDSPGGTVTGSDFIYHHLNELKRDRKLPIVVSMGGMAASGGYYVAMAVGDTKESIFAEPTTWTGSIGVVIPHYDLAGAMEELHISEDSIKSHRLKQMGSIFKHMTPEEKAIFQGLVDDSFTRFKDIVKAGRPKFKEDDEALTKIATGQIFTTNQALANGLVDKEGFIEAAIDRVVELAGLDKSHTKVVEYKRPFSLFEGLMASQSHVRETNLATMLQLASPRAFYLCTWLPPLAHGAQ
jgi:protease-4